MAASHVVGSHSKNIILILLSFIAIPWTSLITICSWIWSSLIPGQTQQRRRAARENSSFQPRTILVTGVGMSKGLAIARLFYEAGHDVIGADFSPLACGRVSRSLDKFYVLRKPSETLGSAPYVDDLLRTIQAEEVDLWCSCSGVASAVEDGEAKEIIEARTPCKAVQFDVSTTQTLHEKNTFIEHTKKIGLGIPETHTITTITDVESALSKAPEDRKFIMKPIGMDDANRGDMTLLPKATFGETHTHLRKLQISKGSPWILQQYINGPEYCTHAVVIKGQVKAFVACPSAELLMHYVALPSDSKLSQAMLEFTQQYAAEGGQSFTGHLSFDFMIDKCQMDGEHSIRDGVVPVLYPIECNPRAHTAVVLFNHTPGMAKAYLSLLEPAAKSNGQTNSIPSSNNIVRPQKQYKYYWIGHDLVELILEPLLALATAHASASPTQLARNVGIFLNRLLSWRDGTFELWDPLPFWWLYQIYWPAQFWLSLTTGKKWSRINVSTTKMFGCAD